MHLAAEGQNGMVAAGHQATAEAACEILGAGGNAFDAVIAAHLSACVAEPVLASLGGGGFLLAAPAKRAPVVYDFFVQSPLAAFEGELDFRPIHGDFGDATQEFHIGLASVATPGTAAGLEAIHADLCRMPMADLIEPACRLARDGIKLNEFQAYIHRILEPILTATPEVCALFAPQGHLLGADEWFRAPAMAQAFEALAREGANWFYEGEPARLVSALCAERGGHLSEADFAAYQVIKRHPLTREIRGHQVLTNPVPSVGGSLILFLLEMLAGTLPDDCSYHSPEHLVTLAHGMRQTGLARRQSGLAVEANDAAGEALFEPDYLKDCAQAVSQRPLATRGTTHISAIDGDGNLASMTITNGEGSGVVMPSTGIHLNNMLGEEDLNPRGFHRWHPNQRLSSMMAPTVVLGKEGTTTALGSGGSNRIRTAVAQVLANNLLFGRDLKQSIEGARMHLEGDLLNIEPHFPKAGLDALQATFPGHLMWSGRNLFFGGVHAVQRSKGVSGTQSKTETRAMADPRRGGYVAATRDS